MKRKTLVIAAIASLAFVITGGLWLHRKKNEVYVTEIRLHALASNPPIAWLVKQISNGHAEVQVLAPSGGCGHGFQPTDAELMTASQANVWFQAGLEFEETEWANRLAKNLPQISQTHLLPTQPKNRAKNICVPSDSRALHSSIWEETSSPPKTPHYWMSIPHLMDMGRHIHDFYADSMLESKEFNDGKTITSPSPSWWPLLDSLRSRHAHLQSLLAPLAGQTFLADHPAYTYFAADYGLKQLVIEEEGHPTTDAHLTDLIRQAKEAQVKVLFLAEEENRQIAETVAKAVGAKVVRADPNEENTPALLERMAQELVKAHGTKP